MLYARIQLKIRNMFLDILGYGFQPIPVALEILIGNSNSEIKSLIQITEWERGQRE